VQNTQRIQAFTQNFSNVLRTKFLKSFEEKIREIEAARNRELEDVRRQHEEAIRIAREGWEKKAAEGIRKIAEIG